MTHRKFWIKPHGIAILLFATAMIIFEGYIYFIQLKVNWIEESNPFIDSLLAVCGAILIVAPKFGLPSWAIYDYMGRDKSGGRIAGAAFILCMVFNWQYIPEITAPAIGKFLQYLLLIEGLMAAGFAASVLDVSKLSFGKKKTSKKKRSNSKTSGSSTANDFTSDQWGQFQDRYANRGL